MNLSIAAILLGMSHACSALVGRQGRVAGGHLPMDHFMSTSYKNSVAKASSAENTNRSIFADSKINSRTAGRLVEPRGKAFPLQTPHSGRHFLPSHPAYRRWENCLLSTQKRWGRFTEGWYYRLTIPDQHVSFAIIISIEDAGRSSKDLALACIQVVGPDDGYLCQVDRDDTKFWAWKKQQGLGCTFSFQPEYDTPDVRSTTTALDKKTWQEQVESGFQILPTEFLGRIRGRDGTTGSLFDESNRNMSCDFDFSINSLCGYGDADSNDQKSTAGWLASFAVFEPHWQVTIADARATGRITWNGTAYDFSDAPFYAEKNWGAALPMKWYWTQCNSFDGYEQLSVTAGGGIRKIPFGRESLGMVAIHYNGQLFKAVPWTGAMSWKVATWGSWELSGNSTFGERPFEVKVVYECDPNDTPGLVFRAPTPDEGMVRHCRDTFAANTTLTLWELVRNKETKAFERKEGPPLIDRARSSQGGAEVGGGPWWDEWKGDSVVKQPIRFLLRFPYHLQRAQGSVLHRLKRVSRRQL